MSGFYPVSGFRDSDFLIEVALGKIPGYSLVHKFGSGIIGTALTPVTESGFYRTPTIAATLEFVSSSTNDSATGTGAREITITGLNAAWTEVTQTLITNGTTPVTLDIPLIRLYRWYVSQSGTYGSQTVGSHVGTLTIQESGGGAIWSTILTTPFPLGQSEIGAYTVAAGRSAYLLNLAATVDSRLIVDAVFFQRPNADDVTAPYSGAIRVVNQFIGISTPTFLDFKAVSGPFVGPCDIGFMANVTQTTGRVSVDFELLLVAD